VCLRPIVIIDGSKSEYRDRTLLSKAHYGAAGDKGLFGERTNKPENRSDVRLSVTIAPRQGKPCSRKTVLSFSLYFKDRVLFSMGPYH
jgi:hypothetical protein